MNRGNEINWENFLIDYFSQFRPIISKKEDKRGLTINFDLGHIYIWCDLEVSKQKIKKLEFGRLIVLNNSEKEPNWIKGVFKNNSKRNIEFLQTSFYNEEGESYEINLSEESKKSVAEFLQIPSKIGWTEEEYLIEPDINYKVLVQLDHLHWSVILKDIGEQDLPMLGDSIGQWLRVKFADAFWNNSKRVINRVVISPPVKIG
jgi:hypothetical protein